MIKIKISNKLEVLDAPDKVVEMVKKVLTIPNPLYFKLMRATGNRARAFYGTPRDFKYYKQDGNKLIVPRGMRVRLLSWLDKIGEKYEVTCDFVSIPTKFNNKISLRDYQIPLVESVLKQKEGILLASTGSGKSLMFLEIAARLGQKTTILVPNTVIQDQFVADIRKYFGIEPGIINGNSKTISDITVSTFQSLQSNKDLCHQLSGNTGLLLIDEVQSVATDNKMEIIEMFKPTFLYGTTATLLREDGKAPAVKFYIGEELCHYESTQLSPTVEVIMSREPIIVEEYPDMIECLTENENRNKLIVGIMIGEVMQNRKVLVLCKRRKHAMKLFEMTGWGNPLAYLIDSDDKDRNKLLGQFKRGEKPFQLIIGTTSLLSVGMDIPALDVLVLACDMKSECLTIQSCGRILRIFEGKSNPRIVDIVDRANPILYRQARARISFYRDKGWTVTGI